MSPTGINAGEERANREPSFQERKRKLIRAINKAERLEDQIEELINAPSGRVTNAAKIGELQKELNAATSTVDAYVQTFPRLAKVAKNHGWDVDPEFLPEEKSSSRQSTTPPRTNAGETPKPPKETPENPPPRDPRPPPSGRDPKGLPGIKGKDFKIIKSHKGVQYAVYNMKLEGNRVQFAVRIPKGDRKTYGVKPGEGRPLTREQFRRIEVLGGADELVFHGEDKNPFKGLRRFILNNYEGADFLDDDEVAGKVIAQHILGWTPGEFQNQLKNTKWYKNTTSHQRMWQLDMKKGDRQALVTDVRGKMQDWLEDNYGMGWEKYVKPSQIKQWAQKVAAGEWGTTGNPEVGFNAWVRKQFDRAAEIEGTPAWMQRQSEAEEARKFANRPEEMHERLRSEALAYLGYDKNNTPRLDRSTLAKWAAQLVTGEKNEGEWAAFLRNRKDQLFPYFDKNVALHDEISPYKSIAERTLGDTIEWNDKLLLDFSRLNNKGEPTGHPMSLHDFELKVRQDNRAWKQGTALWEEGLGIVQALEGTLKGVS